MNPLNRLESHFVACAATVVATTLVGTSNADVVYSGVVNIPVQANIDGCYLNVETGVYVNGPGSGAPGWDVNPYGTSTTAVSLYAATGTGYMRNPGAGTSTARTRLDADTSIDVASFFYGSSSATIGTLVGQWSANASGIFGFKFLAADGLVHYGWLRMSMGANAATRTIVDYAYDTIPATGVRAGVGGGPPPAYDPCAPGNPVLGFGANNFTINMTAIDLSIPGAFTIHNANYFKATIPWAGDYTIDTCVSGANTRLAILDGCAPGSNVLATNDDYCGLSSSITGTLAAGQVLYAVVGGASPGATLPAPLTITVTAPPPPPAPECVSATVAVFGSNLFDATASTLTQNVLPGTLAQVGFFKSLFYSFTPTVTGLYTITTCGANNDTKLAIGVVCPGVALPFSAFAYNDDACACGTGCGTSLYASSLNGANTGVPLTQELVAGTTYKILVGGYAAATLATSGDLVIDGPPQTPVCPGDYNGDTYRDGADLATLLSAWGTPDADITGDGLTDGSDLTTLLSGWGPCPL